MGIQRATFSHVYYMLNRLSLNYTIVFHDIFKVVVASLGNSTCIISRQLVEN